MKTKLFFLLLPLLLAAMPVQAQKRQRLQVSLYSAMLLEHINLYRQEYGLQRLRFDPRLIKLAEEHSREMSQQNRVSHEHFEARMKATASRLCVENVGWKTNDPLQRFEEWQHSIANNQNMLAEGITKAGIAEAGHHLTFLACQ